MIKPFFEGYLGGTNINSSSENLDLALNIGIGVGMNFTLSDSNAIFVRTNWINRHTGNRGLDGYTLNLGYTF